MTDEMIERFVKHLDEEFEAGKAYLPNKADWFEGRWTGLGKPADPETARRAADTGVPEDRLKQVARTLTTVPDGFNIHKTLARIIGARQDDRRTVVSGKRGLVRLDLGGRRIIKKKK